MIFSSTPPLTIDPEPFVDRLGEHRHAVGGWSSIYQPRLEYDISRVHNANRVLLWIRESIEWQTDPGIDTIGLFWVDIHRSKFPGTPAEKEHALRVLKKYLGVYSLD